MAFDEGIISMSFISGEQAAKADGISRVAIFKHVSRLRREGYKIESAMGRGYLLVPRFDGLLPMEIKARIGSDKNKHLFGGEVITLDCTDSTQKCLRGLAEGGAKEGTVVISQEQGEGRGRMGRGWSSPRGGLWFSILLRPSIPVEDLHKLSLLFGLAVSLALDRLGFQTVLKWPNDVLAEGRKICGVLTEASIEPDNVDYVIVGIGVNVNFSSDSLPNGIRAGAISTFDITGKKADRAELLCSILRESERLYIEASKTGFEAIIDGWKKRLNTIGRMVSVASPAGNYYGRAVSIDSNGFLVVETEKGKICVSSGDVAILPGN